MFRTLSYRAPGRTTQSRRRRITGPFDPAPLELRGLDRDWNKDFYYYLIAGSWPRLLLVLALIYLASNLIFAVGYLMVGGIDGARPGSFADCFFFSVETMATIGYGKLAPESTGANLLMTAQAFWAMLSIALMTGLIFAKFSRPIARVRFSRFAVVCRYEGTPSLMFRMANLRLNQIAEAHLRLSMVRDIVTAEGESFRRIYELQLERERSAAFAMSWTVIHRITETSPLFNLTPEALASDLVAIVASMTGLDGTIFQTLHARHTYGPGDIVWNARLVDIFYDSEEGPTVIDFSRFDEIAEIPREQTSSQH